MHFCSHCNYKSPKSFNLKRHMLSVHDGSVDITLVENKTPISDVLLEATVPSPVDMPETHYQEDRLKNALNAISNLQQYIHFLEKEIVVLKEENSTLQKYGMQLTNGGVHPNGRVL